MGTFAQLVEIVGEEHARRIVDHAKITSKELEEAGVAFKTRDGGLTDEGITLLVGTMAEAMIPKFAYLENAIAELKDRLDEAERPIVERIKEEVDRLPKAVVKRRTRGDAAGRMPIAGPKGTETAAQRDSRLTRFFEGRQRTGGEQRDLGE